jgi:hypothetical protein
VFQSAAHLSVWLSEVFRPTTSINEFCQLSNIVRVLNGIIKKKIKNTKQQREQYSEIAKT